MKRGLKPGRSESPGYLAVDVRTQAPMKRGLKPAMTAKTAETATPSPNPGPDEEGIETFAASSASLATSATSEPGWFSMDQMIMWEQLAVEGSAVSGRLPATLLTQTIKALKCVTIQPKQQDAILWSTTGLRTMIQPPRYLQAEYCVSRQSDEVGGTLS